MTQHCCRIPLTMRGMLHLWLHVYSQSEAGTAGQSSAKCCLPEPPRPAAGARHVHIYPGRQLRTSASSFTPSSMHRHLKGIFPGTTYVGSSKMLLQPLLQVGLLTPTCTACVNRYIYRARQATAGNEQPHKMVAWETFGEVGRALQAACMMYVYDLAFHMWLSWAMDGWCLVSPCMVRVYPFTLVLVARKNV